MKRSDFYTAVSALSLIFMIMGALPIISQAASTSQTELNGRPITPQQSSESLRQDRLINELYTHYVDCLEASGSEEACYLKWSRECQAVFQDECALLEEEMFPTALTGDESC